MHSIHNQENSAPELQGSTPIHANEELSSLYLSLTSYIERLHRLLLDVIKDDFERQGIIDVSSVQALLLYNIGNSEVSAGELRTRGYYQGSNVSYNLKKLNKARYIHQERCTVDRRSVRVRLTEKGLDIRHLVCALWDRHIESFATSEIIGLEDFQKMSQSLQALENFWGNQIRYIY